MARSVVLLDLAGALEEYLGADARSAPVQPAPLAPRWTSDVIEGQRLAEIHRASRMASGRRKVLRWSSWHAL